MQVLRQQFHPGVRKAGLLLSRLSRERQAAGKASQAHRKESQPPAGRSPRRTLRQDPPLHLRGRRVPGSQPPHHLCTHTERRTRSPARLLQDRPHPRQPACRRHEENAPTLQRRLVCAHLLVIFAIEVRRATWALVTSPVGQHLTERMLRPPHERAVTPFADPENPPKAMEGSAIIV